MHLFSHPPTCTSFSAASKLANTNTQCSTSKKDLLDSEMILFTMLVYVSWHIKHDVWQCSENPCFPNRFAWNGRNFAPPLNRFNGPGEYYYCYYWETWDIIITNITFHLILPPPPHIIERKHSASAETLPDKVFPSDKERKYISHSLTNSTKCLLPMQIFITFILNESGQTCWQVRFGPAAMHYVGSRETFETCPKMAASIN